MPDNSSVKFLHAARGSLDQAPFETMDWDWSSCVNSTGSSSSCHDDDRVQQRPPRKTLKRPASSSSTMMSPSPKHKRSGTEAGKKLIFSPLRLELPLRNAKQGVLLTGSMFSGMGTDHFAAQTDFLAKWTLVPMFWCESDPAAQTFLRANVPAQKCFPDITDDVFLEQAGPVDIISAGFPCQPFSTAGRNASINDPRGVLVLSSSDT